MLHLVWKQIFTKLAEEDTSEVVINGYDQIFVRKHDGSYPIQTKFSSITDYEESIGSQLVPLMHTDEDYSTAKYIFEGQLKYDHNGTTVMSRCHIGLPPLTNTPQITMTRHSTALVSLSDIVSTGSMSAGMYDFLVASVKAGLNIVISGSSGSGKTLMLSALTQFFNTNDRVGVAEDVPELSLGLPNVTYWYSYPEKPGRDQNMVADLNFVVKQFQRNRCDKLVVGETRGAEFFSFLTAANSGITGCLTTLHADSPVEALAKMSQFAAQGAPNLPLRVLNQKIANSVDLVVQLTRAGNRYRTTHIQEVVPVIGATDEAKIVTATLYKWDETKDLFYKDNTVSDQMRKRFANAGQDLSFHFNATNASTVQTNTFERQRLFHPQHTRSL